MFREELKSLGATPGDLRKFGLTVGGVFALLALIFFLRHRGYYWCFLVPAAPLIGLGLIAPKILKPVYLGWMFLALALGAIVSTILLLILFYLVVTPIGWLARLFGNDFLLRRWEPQAASYWHRRDVSQPRDKHELEQQF